MNGPDPIDPYDEADETIGRLYNENERLRKENERIMEELRALRVIKGINDFTEAEERELDALRETVKWAENLTIADFVANALRPNWLKNELHRRSTGSNPVAGENATPEGAEK